MLLTSIDLPSDAKENIGAVKISVIIPHLNQPGFLRDCLAAIHAQEGLESSYEVIVVDNGSRSLPEAVCAQFEGVRLLREDRPGPGPARNAGIAAASGEILAFIDADCRAHPRWLATIERAFGDPEVQVIGGDVQVPIADSRHPTALECYERIYAYRNRAYIASGYSGTGNLAMRARTYERVGPFAGVDVAEDRDWGMRAGKLGIAIRYVPEMVVYHPARREFSEMKNKWDRHVLHDFSRVSGLAGRLGWVLRALAIGLSPLGEALRIATSERISGMRQRWLALRCLTRIRLYRCWRMLRVLFDRGARSAEKVWNRNGD